MNFSDLLALPYDKQSGIIDLTAIRAALPNTPDGVAQQFYADHGRKDELQSVYGTLNIDRMKWTLITETAEILIASSMNPNFRRRFQSVGERASRFSEQNWKCIDTREKVQAHWAQYKTWLIPPVMLMGTLIRSDSHLHLAEGHTRLGLLAGLVEHGILSKKSTHSVWLGAENALG